MKFSLKQALSDIFNAQSRYIATNAYEDSKQEVYRGDKARLTAISNGWRHYTVSPEDYTVTTNEGLYRYAKKVFGTPDAYKIHEVTYTNLTVGDQSCSHVYGNGSIRDTTLDGVVTQAEAIENLKRYESFIKGRFGNTQEQPFKPARHWAVQKPAAARPA